MAARADESGPGPSDPTSDGTLDTTEEQGQVTRTEPRLAPGTDPEPGTRVGEYLIERKVGRGGMGTVYAAVHPVIGKKAAIKVIAWDLCRDASFVARFVREARAVNRIHHPNIVEAFSIGQLEDGRCCYTMEWLEGISLRQRLSGGPMRLPEVTAILDEIADALQAVHEAGIIHRDLTPQNLFLAEVRGRRALKILDFGIAKETGVDTSGTGTRSGVVLGTPAYVSPEQAAGETVDHRADIYGLGVIAYEMLTGRPPFADLSTTAVLARKMVELPPSIGSLVPDISPQLAGLIDSMLAIDPQRRPSLAALRAAIRPPPGAEPPVVPVPAPRRGPRIGRRRAAALLAGAAVGALGYFAIRGMTSPEGGERPPRPAAAAGAAPAAAPVHAVAPGPADAAPTRPAADAAPPAPAGVIDVTVDVDDARIELDDAVVGAAVRRVRIPVDPAGAHRLVVSAPGHARFERRVQVAAGAVASIDVELPPARARRPAGRHGRERDRPRPAGTATPPAENPDYLLPPKKLPD